MLNLSHRYGCSESESSLPSKAECHISANCRHDDLMIWVLKHKACRRQDVAHAPVGLDKASQDL